VLGKKRGGSQGPPLFNFYDACTNHFVVLLIKAPG
jgi:hypothetical protein